MMSGLNEGESKSVFQAVEEETKLLSEIADKITETDKNAEKNSSVNQSNDSNASACKDCVLSDLEEDAVEVSSKSPFSEGLESESQSENSGLTSNVKKNELSQNNTKDLKEHFSSIFEGCTEKDLEDDSIPAIKFQSEYSYEEIEDYQMTALLSSVKNLADCAEKAICQCPKGDFKSVFAHDSDDEIPPLAKVQDGVPAVSENGQMKLVESFTIKSSLDVESTCSQKCESVKNSTDENHKTEPSNSLTNIDSGEDTNKLLQTFDEVLIVNPSNKSDGEKEGGDGKMSGMPMTNMKVSGVKLQYRSLSITEKCFVPKNVLDEPLRSTSSKDHNATNADEDNLSDLPELVPLHMPVKSPTQLKIDYFRDLEGSSGRCESPLHMSPRKLFPKSKLPSPLEKPSLKKVTTEKAVIESEHHIVPVLQSSVACGSDTISNKSLEPENQICPKCEGQVTKTSEGKDEITKCIPKSKHLYCIGISGPKRHARNMDPKVICTGRRFRILLNVSLFEKESLSICKMVDKIDVYGKQVLKNEYGEEIHEVHQVFRIPLFVDDSFFTASITENEMLLIDAPFKGNEEESIKK